MACVFSGLGKFGNRSPYGQHGELFAEIPRFLSILCRGDRPALASRLMDDWCWPKAAILAILAGGLHAPRALPSGSRVRMAGLAERGPAVHARAQPYAAMEARNRMGSNRQSFQLSRNASSGAGLIARGLPSTVQPPPDRPPVKTSVETGWARRPAEASRAS